MPITLTDDQVSKIKDLLRENTDKLLESLSGVDNKQAPGEIKNQNAPCLISHTIHNQTAILHEINKAEARG